MYTVQIKTVFNSVSFSTEVHAHFWALSHIYNAALFDCHMAGAISMHFMYTIQPCTMSRHFMQSHKHRVQYVFVCLHCWQNVWDLFRATAVTWESNGYRNKSQHRKLTQEKKIFPPLLPGLEPATFRSRVRRSNH